MAPRFERVLRADLDRIRPNALCLSATTQNAADARRDLYSALAASYGGILAYGGSAFRGGYERTIPGLHFGGTVIDAVREITAAIEGRSQMSLTPTHATG